MYDFLHKQNIYGEKKTHLHSILVILHQLTLLLVSVWPFLCFNDCHDFGYCHGSLLLKTERTYISPGKTEEENIHEDNI